VNNVTKYNPGDVITVEEKGALSPLDWGWANVQLQWLIQFLIELWFQATALWSYTVWWTWQKVERSAQWVNTRSQILKSQLIPLFNMLNEVMWDIAEHWLAMMWAYMDNDTMLKVYNDNTMVDEFKKRS
jgi:hypothetical protein